MSSEPARTEIARALFALSLLGLVAGCGAPLVTEDAATPDAPAPDTSLLCADDAACADDLFCNGVERCDPTDADADADGCVAATDPPCESDETCSESTDACACVDSDGDGHDAISCGGDDCDDDDATRSPGLPEICDAANTDEDCDTATFGERDADLDGAFDAACCNDAGGTLVCGTDCDDVRPAVNPAATEVCNARDDDCDDGTDEEVLLTFYLDADMDTYGIPGTTMTGCAAPTGYATTSTDCDDTTNARNPGNAEACDAIDNDCDTTIDEMVVTTLYRDVDGDGFGNAATSMPGCAATAEWVTSSTDCNDANVAVHPGASEVCDTIDNDCDTLVDELVVMGTFYRDVDGDGYGLTAMSTMACTMPIGFVSMAADCDDTRATVHPSTAELCDGLDTDCTGGLGFAGEDDDSDGHGDAALCAGAPAADDCDDLRATMHPGAVELCNRLDDDCSSGGGVLAAEDADSDGHASPSATCTGGLYPKDDCDDTRALVIPGFAECSAPTTRRVCGPGGFTLTECVAPNGLCNYLSAACSNRACGDDVVHPGEECDDRLGGCSLCRIVPGPTRPLTPYSGSNEPTLMPLFRVTPVTGATSYEIDVGIEPTLSRGTATQLVFATTSGRPAVALPTGRLFWHARAVTASGTPGPWSTTWSFRNGRARSDTILNGVPDVVVSDPSFPGTPPAGDGRVSVGGFVLTSPVAAGQFGRSLAVTDITTDGIDDVIVSTGTSIHVYRGAGTPDGVHFDLPLVATALAALGDVDGDGHPDLGAIAAPGVLVFYGQALGFGTPETITIAATSLAGADVDGDGRNEIVIGVSAAGATGEIVIVEGNSGVPLDAAPRTTLAGAFAGFRTGQSVAAADLDRDGYADVIAGGIATDLAGDVQVWRGSATGAGGAAVHALVGSAGDRLGHAIATGADVDDDGFLDYAVGAPPANVVYLVDGGATIAAGADRTILGSPSDSLFGWAMAMIGHSDGGTARIVVGAPAGASGGRAAVYDDSVFVTEVLGLPGPGTMGSAAAP